MTTLRDEIAKLVRDSNRGFSVVGYESVLARAILELMDNRPAPVRVKLIRSATRDQNNGIEISVDSNATDADRERAMKQALLAWAESMDGIYGKADTSIEDALAASLEAGKT